MKNKDFFYQQYNTIDWQNQDKTKINLLVNEHIIKNIISKKDGSSMKIFDIGFGIGFTTKLLYEALHKQYDKLLLAGCEPSEKNYNYFVEQNLKLADNTELATYNSTFLATKTDETFDFITAVYVFPNFLFEEMEGTAKKINDMLEPEGKFILVVANQEYLHNKLKSLKGLFIEKNDIEMDGKVYEEILYYSDIPEIGKVIDYNRSDEFYFDLFDRYGFELAGKDDLDDSGFVCSVFVFLKK